MVRLVFFLASFLVAVPGFGGVGGQPPKADRQLRTQQDVAAERSPGERTALVIGNGAYRDSPLKNPVADARAMAAALEKTGFTVTKLENANRIRMREALRDWGNRISLGGVGLFYYAGHGMQVKGRNFLVPVDADIRGEDEVATEALELDAILAKMESARNSLNILILDACRNNPFARSFRSSQQGLAQIDAPLGTFVAYATAPGRTAADGEGGNGLYTTHLLAQLQRPGFGLEEVFKATRQAVVKASHGAQVPWENSSLMGHFSFSGEPPVKAPVVAEPPVSAPRTDGSDRYTNAFGMAFVRVPSGSFVMGGMGSGLEPLHRVKVAGFWFGQTEVTQAQWQSVTGNNPSFFEGEDRPVEQVSFDDIQGFLSKLNARDSKNRYRLPTEAEWEYASRAGAAGEAPEDLNAVSWNLANSENTTHPVGSKQPNAWGLYDMLGNVWEWCQDTWHDDYQGAPSDGSAWIDEGGARVIRGGRWDKGAEWARHCVRGFGGTAARYNTIGLRLVRVPKAGE